MKCETCNDTAYYGDNGPGIHGNGEYAICDDCNQSPETGQVDAIVKCPLPDVFAGDLNTRRIEKYQEIKKRYMVSEGTVRDLFNAGIDWYKQIIEESGT